MGRPAAATFHWGIVPPWATDPKPGPINARSETVANKPTFAEAFRKRRCLIVADGFYEWAKLPGRRKQPWHCRLSGGGPFAFAGLWEAWRPASGPPLLTRALLTTEANELVRPVHRRMPVILRPEDYALWIDRGNDDPAKVRRLLGPFAMDRMEALAVGPWVNDAQGERIKHSPGSWLRPGFPPETLGPGPRSCVCGRCCLSVDAI